MVLFPTLEWMEEYQKAMNEDEDLDEAGEGWGVDWNGDFLFEITDLPIDQVAPKDLPSELTKRVSDDLSDQMKMLIQNSSKSKSR